MRQLTLRSSRFRREREADWTRLESLVRRVEDGSLARLSDEELLALPELYRSTLSSLSAARAISLDAALIDYLESLGARAYFVVYGARAKPLQRLARFFRHDWPAAVASLWRETIFATVLLFAGIAAAFVLVGQDPDWFYSFVPRELAGGRDPSATTAFLRETLYDQPKGTEGLGVFASFLFTHNARVAIMTFALGFAFALPTALLLAYNGCTMGAFVALFASRGLGFEAVGWLAIHGVTELFAVILASAAGFRIGLAVAFPGTRTRLDAVRYAGRSAALVMAGVVIMLILAGVLEGFGRQLITADLARYGIALASLILWLAYFYLPRRVLPLRSGGRQFAEGEQRGAVLGPR